MNRSIVINKKITLMIKVGIILWDRGSSSSSNRKLVIHHLKKYVVLWI